MDRELDFASLLEPVSAKDFFGDYWERKPLHVRRQKPEYYRTLAPFESIDRLVTTRTTGMVSVRNADAALDVGEFLRPDGMLDVAKACQLFANGATLLVREAQKHLDSLSILCRRVEIATSARCRANLYVTPPGGKGFDRHYDTHDVFLLQVQGAKQWTVYDPPLPLPLAGQHFDAATHKPTGPATSFELDAGDLLYIPRGFLHEGRSSTNVSIHVTLGILAYRWADVVMEAVAKLCLSDPAFRKALPTDLVQPGFDSAAAQATFAGLLKRLAQQATPHAALGHFADELVTGSTAVVPGQLSQLARLPTASADTYFGVRPTTLHTVHVAGDALMIRAHGRQIVVPSDAEELVRYALSEPRYTVRDLPGDFDEASKLLVVNRLVEEGLVWIVDET